MFNHRTRTTQKAFTLIEVIIVVAIAGIISVAVGAFGGNVFSYNRTLSDSLVASFEGGEVVQDFVAEVRSAGPSITGSFPIVEASTTAITFYADISGDSNREQIRYFKDGATLKKTVTPPGTNPNRYVGASSTTGIVVQNILSTSTPLFKYYDDSYTGTSTAVALTQPVDPRLIRLIQITIPIERDPNRAPGPIIIESRVSIRNLKDNL
ncbi:MAG TPA: prepilin-type N-terminal cleavage/methylation domain-containing protein [Candidatus Paceibacterota bacterium]|nr:prepilin-type N-terminal cleavage/methylation domain-containing protein [Candidatus Paceibacterota bacterium]